MAGTPFDKADQLAQMRAEARSLDAELAEPAVIGLRGPAKGSRRA